MQWSLAAAALALTFPALPALSQIPQITYAEAVQRALEVQPAIVQARGDQRNANAQRRAATGAFLPSLSVGGSSSHSSSSRVNLSTGEVTPPTSYSGTLGLSLDLFTGFRRLAASRAAAATQAAADAGFVNQRYQVTANTAQLFFAALADEELVRVAQAQVDRAKAELQTAVNRFQAGAATRSDTLTSTVDYGNALLALLQAQANLATAQANLGRQVGVDHPLRAAPDSTAPPLPDTSALRGEVLDSAPQIRQAEAQARAAGAQISVARAEYWPTISASYSNGYTGLDAPWSTLDNYTNNWSLRFSVSWTLFNGFNREADQVSAAVQRDIASSHSDDLRRQLNAQYTEQIAALFTAHTQIGISVANVAAAAEALRVQQERYKLGAATQLDVLTAEANLTQAEVSQVQARYDYLIARAQLEALVGHGL